MSACSEVNKLTPGIYFLCFHRCRPYFRHCRPKCSITAPRRAAQWNATPWPDSRSSAEKPAEQEIWKKIFLPLSAVHGKQSLPPLLPLPRLDTSQRQDIDDDMTGLAIKPNATITRPAMTFKEALITPGLPLQKPAPKVPQTINCLLPQLPSDHFVRDCWGPIRCCRCGHSGHMERSYRVPRCLPLQPTPGAVALRLLHLHHLALLPLPTRPVPSSTSTTPLVPYRPSPSPPSSPLMPPPATTLPGSGADHPVEINCSGSPTSPVRVYDLYGPNLDRSPPIASLVRMAPAPAPAHVTPLAVIDSDSEGASDGSEEKVDSDGSPFRADSPDPLEGVRATSPRCPR